MFLTFAKIGSFTIGGGYAMIQMMEREVVEKKRWLDHEEFMNTLVVAQSTPGLFAIDMASHIGLKLKGIKGGIVAALATALPSIFSILLIAIFFQTFKDNVHVENSMNQNSMMFDDLKIIIVTIKRNHNVLCLFRIH